jgi:hypothetical protein
LGFGLARHLCVTTLPCTHKIEFTPSSMHLKICHVSTRSNIHSFRIANLEPRWMQYIMASSKRHSFHCGDPKGSDGNEGFLMVSRNLDQNSIRLSVVNGCTAC